MGSIAIHQEVSTYVIKELAQIRPDEEYIYLYLGSFLTDISQLRDPYANFVGKRALLDTARAGSFWLSLPILGLPLAHVLRLPTWIDELLGTLRGNQRYGALVRFLSHIARFLTHQLFADESNTRAWLSRLRSGVERDPLQEAELLGFPVQPMTPGEVDRVFGPVLGFTQYYPHEHLDLPPYREGPAQRDSVLYRPQRRKLMGYLEEQIQYISEELTQLELRWVRHRSMQASHQARRDVLVRLGHILHAIEDYFFHSNFAELFHWKQLQTRYPRRRVEDAGDYDWMLVHSWPERLSDPESIKLRRRFARRLRYPVYEPDRGFGASGRYRESPNTSSDATNIVYTGGFGQSDLFHTVHSALIALEELLRNDERGRHVVNSGLVLIKVMFDRNERHQVAISAAYKEQRMAEHKKQVLDGSYERIIVNLQRDGNITAAGARELRKAIAIDKEFDERFESVLADLPGVGGFLISFFAALQRSIDESAREVERLNQRGARSVVDKGTFNGASEETIGSHSLLAKDEAEDNPLRKQAVALAMHASAMIGSLLAQRVNQEPSLNRGLDWDSIVRHYLRFPSGQRDRWESLIDARVAAGSQLWFAEAMSIADRPRFGMLGPDRQGDKLQRRREGRKAELLEQRYRGLEARVDV